VAVRGAALIVATLLIVGVGTGVALHLEARRGLDAALLAAAQGRPNLPARSLADIALAFGATQGRAFVRPEGSALPRRIGAGEQRSAARVCPAPWRRVGEKALCSAASSGDAESSQPPSRSEQRSAPSASPRAAPLSLGRALPSGPRRTLHARQGFDKLSPNGIARGASPGSA
jgi:hypothetical protein